MAGLATASRFLDEFCEQLADRLKQVTGQPVRSRSIFPYGDASRNPYRQFREIRRDTLRRRSWHRSIGGRRAAEEIGRHSRSDCRLLIGHSGGGIAALHAAQLLLQSDEHCRQYRIVQIGSPRCMVPSHFRDQTLYLYAADETGKAKDPICKLGSWGGWERTRYGIWRWNSALYAPAAILPLQLAGGHPDYFRSHLVNASGQTNLESVLRAIADWFIRSMASSEKLSNPDVSW